MLNRGFVGECCCISKPSEKKIKSNKRANKGYTHLIKLFSFIVLIFICNFVFLFVLFVRTSFVRGLSTSERCPIGKKIVMIEIRL